jgi:hypothetical protein
MFFAGFCVFWGAYVNSGLLKLPSTDFVILLFIGVIIGNQFELMADGKRK